MDIVFGAAKPVAYFYRMDFVYGAPQPVATAWEASLATVDNFLSQSCLSLSRKLAEARIPDTFMSQSCLSLSRKLAEARMVIRPTLLAQCFVKRSLCRLRRAKVCRLF